MDNMIKISELQKAYPIVDDDVFIVNQENRITKVLETRYTTTERIAEYLTNKLESLLNIFIPIGSIKLYAGNIQQYDKLNGWLLCNGQYVSRVKYKKLFDVIGGLYGPVNAESFPLPNFIGKVPMGYCGINNDPVPLGEPTKTINLADTGGEYEHKLTQSEMPIHTHLDTIGHTHDYMDLTKFHWWNNDGGSKSATTPQNGEVFAEVNRRKTGIRNPKYDEKTTESKITKLTDAGGDMPHNNMQPYLAINYIIKY
jgi:microcystin-dependent protein